ncbi:hypothetical protein C8J55DRAFT_163909 [Lentinula edodes]|uniref:MYND-type domain-containing protein n=1 Tax=Lentinula lateritia TaxID=40482 RepID=A0A9W9E023_9AGAR|nr:hypothetical protein C8J55DRAFT_163909 [Lentinula edodes]
MTSQADYLDTTITHVVQSLKDPLHPAYCCRYYLYFLHSIHHDILISDGLAPITPSDPSKGLYSLPDINHSDLCRSYPELFRALMAFLRAPRTRVDMESLARSMEVCHCNLELDPLVQEFHSWNWISEPSSRQRDSVAFSSRSDTLESLIHALVDVLQLALALWEAEQFHSSARGTSWPSTRQDILGREAEEITVSATMICRWLDEYPCLALIRFITLVAEGPSIMPAFLHSATLPKNIVLLLDKCIEEFSPAINAGNVDIGMQTTIIFTVGYIFKLMKQLETVPDGISIAYFYDEHAESLLDSLSKLARIHESLACQDMIWSYTFASTGGAVHSKLVLPYDKAKYHHLITEASKVTYRRRIDTHDTYPDVQKIFLIFMTVRQCANPVCKKEFDDSWKRCSGCSRVLYCSLECQKIDWKNPGKPHGRLCKTMRLLGEATKHPAVGHSRPPPLMTNEKFTARCNKAGIAPDAIREFNRYMAKDVRVWKRLMNEYSPRYPHRIA